MRRRVHATTIIAIGAAGFMTVDGAPDTATRSPAALCSPEVDIAAVLRSDPDVARRDAEIDSTFRATLAEVSSSPPGDPYGRVIQLGKLLLFDRQLSVNGDVACVSCHSPSTGFTGPVESINRTIVAYPGSSGNLVSARKPQSYGYAPFAPVLHFVPADGGLAGGNFWDMRATGIVVGNPAAEQAMGPPTNPLEMALPDQACAVYRISRSRYRPLFEQVWGAESFAIRWPADVERVCSTAGPPPADDTLPVHLAPVDRGIARQSYTNMARAMASFEASPEVSPFSSRFDSALAHPDRRVLTPDEMAGWAIFRGKGRCNTCHLDGTAAAAEGVTDSLRLPSLTDMAPLFTDFTAANLGVPRNPALRFYCENQPVKPGYVPNPDGARFVDRGVGGFLSSADNPNPAWRALADETEGQVRVPTLRNVDMRPREGFVKAYMHNGYLKSLEEVVHFYNTRDVLRRCRGENDPGERVDCWPPPEIAANVDSTVGNLRLTPLEEQQLVAFMKTLTDALPPPRTARR